MLDGIAKPPPQRLPGSGRNEFYLDAVHGLDQLAFDLEDGSLHTLDIHDDALAVANERKIGAVFADERAVDFARKLRLDAQIGNLASVFELLEAVVFPRFGSTVKLHIADSRALGVVFVHDAPPIRAKYFSARPFRAT